MSAGRRMPVLWTLPISHPAAMPESLCRGRHARDVLPLGDRCSPGRRGDDTRRMLAAISGQGHVRAGTGLPTPCRREDSLHVSQTRLDRAVWRFRQRKITPGYSRACSKRLSTLSFRGHAIGRWPRFEAWQGGFWRPDQPFLIQVQRRECRTMSRFFTCHWRSSLWRPDVNPEEPIRPAGSSKFTERGVVGGRGHAVYIVSVTDGQFYLGGRMCVSRVVSRGEAVRFTGNHALYDADEWVIDETRNGGTRMHLRRRCARCHPPNPVDSRRRPRAGVVLRVPHSLGQPGDAGGTGAHRGFGSSPGSADCSH